jgi:hypothetical protein
MTGKHYQWHKSWSRDQDGHLLHNSGLRVLVIKGDGFTDLETDDASLAIFQAKETARGVKIEDLAARLRRLLKEAAEWHPRNP